MFLSRAISPGNFISWNMVSLENRARFVLRTPRTLKVAFTLQVCFGRVFVYGNFMSSTAFPLLLLYCEPNYCLSKKIFSFFSGLVSKQKSEMAKNGEMLGQKYDNGWIWTVRGNGETLATATRDDTEKRQRKRKCRPMAFR